LCFLKSFSKTLPPILLKEKECATHVKEWEY
jgi:hypothetical protein